MCLLMKWPWIFYEKRYKQSERGGGQAWTILETLCKAELRGRARGWATPGVHPLSWLLSNNWLEEMCGTLTKFTSSNRLLLTNQDKGCTPSIALLLALAPGPALRNLAGMLLCWQHWRLSHNYTRRGSRLSHVYPRSQIYRCVNHLTKDPMF